MRVLIYSDNHWCQYSSIVRKRGEKYSLRLENQIASINWAERLSLEMGCNKVVHLGDFFDSAVLNAEEISALKEINWNKHIFHYFLCGNHEMGSSDLSFNSIRALGLCPFIDVIDKPYMQTEQDVVFIYLPYILEENRESLLHYIPSKEECEGRKRIVFSHNDIKGVQMGQFISKEGFEIDDIRLNCDLFINGHLHNGEKISDKIINVGNLTGQNFSENAFKYDHCAYILDTDTMKVEVYENPFALNFYKLDFTNSVDYNIFNQLKNAVITVKCKEKDYKSIGDAISNLNVVESRIIVEPDIIKDTSMETTQMNSIDHLEMFKTYILNTLGNSLDVEHELEEVTK